MIQPPLQNNFLTAFFCFYCKPFRAGLKEMPRTVYFLRKYAARLNRS
ncbi:MAG: hypothetical protein ALAOOOJD_02370 [bacterium]|nr:hypothetical protein [bacterium]